VLGLGLLAPLGLGSGAAAQEGAPLGCPGSFELEVVALVNLERAQGGSCGGTYYPPAGPVALDVRLSEASQLHSDDMAAHGFVGHTGSNGSDMVERADATGYDWSGLGENAAGGYPSPASVVAAWMASSGHCANLMNGAYSHIGVGYSWLSSSAYQHYWTQLFGKPWNGAARLGPESECPACSNTLDDDGDGNADAVFDLGCHDGAGELEDPQCQDGLDNDGGAGIDFDGGFSALGGASPEGADPQCSEPWQDREATSASSCGLGVELVPLLGLAGWLRRRRGAAGSR
jgi:hypothetical protein